MTNKTRYLNCMIDGFKRAIQSFKEEIDPELMKRIAKRLDAELDGCDKLQRRTKRKLKVTATGKLPLEEGKEYHARVKLSHSYMLLDVMGTAYQINKPKAFEDDELNVWFDTRIKMERYQGKGKHSNRIYGRIHKA